MSEQEYERRVDALEHGGPSARALALALRYGQIDGDHHKAWVIDQMVRLMCGEGEYKELVALYEQGGEYEWNEGISP